MYITQSANMVSDYEPCDLNFLGLCKHLHLSLIVASQRGTDVEEARLREATQIVSEGTYFLDSPNLEILNDGGASIVNTNSMSCTCVAYSHGITCICIKVAHMIVPANLSLPAPETVATTDVDTSPKACKIDNMKAKLDEVSEWLQSGSAEQCPNFNEVQQNVMQLHASVFSKFKKVTKERKIKPLFPQRKSVTAKVTTDSSAPVMEHTSAEEHKYASRPTKKSEVHKGHQCDQQRWKFQKAREVQKGSAFHISVKLT